MKRLIPALAILAAASPAQARLHVDHALPATDAFVDSAALAAFAARHAPAGTAGKLVLSFVMDSAGGVRSVRTLESALPGEVAAMIHDNVAGYVRPQAPWSGGRWWLRLTLRLGPEIALRTERSREEAPRQTASMSEIFTTVRSAGPPSASGRIELRILVGEDGRALRVEPGPGNSVGKPEVERIATQLHFVAGKVDGEAQPMWLFVAVARVGGGR
jgi:hypothetical protein